MGNTLGTCYKDQEGASESNASNIDKKTLQEKVDENSKNEAIKEKAKIDQYGTESKEEEKKKPPTENLETKEEAGDVIIEPTNRVENLRQDNDSWNIEDNDADDVKDPAEDIAGLINDYKAPGYEVMKQEIAKKNASILVSPASFDEPGAGMVFLDPAVVPLPMSDNFDSGDDAKKSVTFQDLPFVEEKITDKDVPVMEAVENKDDKPIAIVVESPPKPAKKKRNETNFVKQTPSEVHLPEEEWIPHTDIWIQTSKGWHLASISRILNTKVEFHLKDDGHTKLVYNKQKFSSRVRKVTAESIDPEVSIGEHTRSVSVEQLKKKNPARVVAVSEPALIQHKARHHEIKFAADSEAKWGVNVDFKQNWKFWTVKKVARGLQFSEKGIKVGWKIIKVKVGSHENVLSDETAKDIKKILMKGKPCTITFQEPSGSISSTTPVKPKPVSTPISRKTNANSHKKIGAVKEGFMKKQGKSIKSWKERFFKLTTDHKLSYYENNFDETPIKSINLREVTRMEEDDGDTDWGIKLTTKPRMWYFRVIEKTTRDEWMHEIRKYMPQKQATVMLRVMKEGLMYKLAPGGWSGGQVRYFVLKRNLEYYNHYGEAKEKKKGEIDINEITMFEETQEGGKNDREFGMRLHTPSRTWSLYVETAQERDDWMQKIKTRKLKNRVECATDGDRNAFKMKENTLKNTLKRKKGFN